MTITVEKKEHTGVIAMSAICGGPHGSLKHEGHKVMWEHVAKIHNGYGDSAEPISGDQLAAFNQVVQAHEKATGGTHHIRVVIFQR